MITIPVSQVEALLSIVVIFFGATIQGAFGIGGALLAAPLLLLINPIFVPLPMLMANVLLTALVTRKEWHSINFRDLKFLLAGRFVGTIPAVVVLVAMSGLAFDFVFGLMILSAVVLSAIGTRVVINPLSLTIAGLASGFMGTVSSIGGPPVALLYQHVHSTQFRATLSIQLLLGGLVSIVAIIFGTRAGLDDLLASLILVPGVLGGYYVSRLGVARVTRESVRLVVLVLSVLGALVVLSRATFIWLSL